MHCISYTLYTIHYTIQYTLHSMQLQCIVYNTVYCILYTVHTDSVLCNCIHCPSVHAECKIFSTLLYVLCTLYILLIFKLRIKRLMKRWKHSGGNVINAVQVNLVSTCCLYQTRHNSMN